MSNVKFVFVVENRCHAKWEDAAADQDALIASGWYGAEITAAAIVDGKVVSYEQGIAAQGRKP